MVGLRLKLKNFRAIADADIELADLTVLTGVNASGKSTIARLFHNVIETNRSYTLWGGRAAFSGVFLEVVEPLFTLFDDLHYSTQDLRKVVHNFFKVDVDILNDLIIPFQDRVKDVFSKMEQDGVERIDERLWNAFKRALPDVGEDSSVKTLKGWLEQRFDDVTRIYNEYCDRKGDAWPFVFMSNLSELSMPKSDEVSASLIEILDGETCIFDSQKISQRFPQVYSPKKSLYIEKPSSTLPKVKGGKLLLGEDLYNLHDETVELLKGSPEEIRRMGDNKISFLCDGSFEAPLDKSLVRGGEWVYKRSDGRNFQLKECAEGIKSLATVQILENYGLLDSNTLLIIDEPEVHLHPQWIVECANTLVDLVKEKRVRVLVTSHSPYLVQALQQKAYKRLEQGQCCFYLAEKEGSFTYSYQRLGMNIAPIFRTFNVALDQIARFSK